MAKNKYFITLELGSSIIDNVDSAEEFIVEVLEEVRKHHLHDEEDINLVNVKTAYN